MNKIFKCFTINTSIGIVTLYNSIVSIIDFLFLIISLVLLTDGKANLGDIAGIIILIFAIIALPCIVCGICYIWSLFHIQNNLKMARFFGVCNFVMMLFTFLIIATNVDKEKEIERPGLMAFFMILNVLSIVSVIFLCTMNCGYERETQREQTRITRALHNEPAMRQITYPVQHRQDNLQSYVYPIEMEKVEHVIVDIENPQVIYKTEPILPSAPVLSPSMESMEGRPTLR